MKQKEDWEKFSRGYENFGFHVNPDNSVTCREWAPLAQGLFLKGDFNNWEKCALPFKKLDFGKWEITLPPNPDGSCPIPHLSRVKIGVLSSKDQVNSCCIISIHLSFFYIISCMGHLVRFIPGVEQRE
ncbi:1,4-alpha-glucan-branching enzyme-like [Penaeus monodon]|uniref:1,4-alpha-glucan-branching enzyme-like n=1 Tax=Penaeus monodon TaxID=6687 RepID=UPI0018A7910F|nr:1,4-alpha-glucan-branching enzyme-like [Penaeus monodon]